MSFALEVRSYEGAGRHVHDFSQILFPLCGAMELVVEGIRTTVSGSLVAVVPPDHVHLFDPSPDCKLLVMDVLGAEIARDRVPALLRDDKPHLIPIEPWLWRLFSLLSAEVESDARRGEQAGLVALAGLQLIDLSADRQLPPTCHRRLVKVAQSMDEEPARRSVAELASEAALSQSQFHALFRAVAGKSPKQFQIQKLLDRAVDRLVNTSDPVSEIALDLGYQNASSFNRIFRRHFGTTPSAFRASSRVPWQGSRDGP